MFSGIIERTCRVIKTRRTKDGISLELELEELSERTKPGDSISVNGVCLTVTSLQGTAAIFDAVSETIRRSTIGYLSAGDRVNVERSLKIGDRVGGHFVTGHVDGVAVIVSLIRKGDSAEMFISPPADLMPFIAVKGSVALDGVSLTVTNVADSGFAVALIPFTLKNTTLGERRVGDRMNIEVDVLARYASRILQFTKGDVRPLESKLRESGFL